MGSSLSFDRVADIYDATRGLPEDVARKLTDALVAELAAAGADRALEVGVGTGRIARPLAERGVRVCGIDIAPRMLARLREQLGPGHLPPDLVLGDATRLPVRSGSLPAVLMIHVLHLVSAWQRAIEEVRRVLAPTGVFIHHFTRYHEPNPWAASLERRRELFASLGFVPRRRPGPEEIADALRALGGSLRTVVYSEDEERTIPSELVARVRSRIDSWTWEIPDDVFPKFFAEFERWCRYCFGELEREYTQQVQYELEVWSFA